MDQDTVWRHIHQQRRALAVVLESLAEDEWTHDSLCAGWTVRDVAAHIISSPQIRVRELPAILARGGFGYNQMIFRDVKRRGQAPVAEILADFRRYDGSRHKPPCTTHIEPLIDILVHSQDILRPLGRTHDLPRDAAVVAADRSRRLAPLLGAGKLVRSVRMVATDIDWDRGRGPTIEGPIQELLMLCCGRVGDPALLAGEGLATNIGR
jgi:uncharacterized protein (TIGR03083 family)